MRQLWVHRDVEGSASAAWAVLTDLDRWPQWGPSVRHAELDGDQLEAGATGTVTTIVSLSLPFEITTFEPGSNWAWNVSGIGATDHRVTELAPARCRVSFGVPLWAAGYLPVCRLALGRIASIVEEAQA